jgi:hypothetical protein
MIGCSDSLVRNSESGYIPFSDKLAQRIEDATGVSATWLQKAAARWQQGNELPTVTILNTEGKPWHPSRESKFHLTDELVDAAELFYLRFPAYLAPLMGAMFEAFLETDPPLRFSNDRHRNMECRRSMRKYIDTHLLPFLRLVGEFEDESRERFFTLFTARLKERDAATSSKLLDLWNLMHALEPRLPVLALDSSKITSKDKSEEAAPKAPKPRPTKRGTSKM